MPAHTFLVALTIAATALAASVPRPDASPALAARDPAASWISWSDYIADTDGDGVPEYNPHAIVWSTDPPR